MILLHGDNPALSRRRLSEIRSQFTGEVISLDAKETDPTNFSQATQSQALFALNKLVIIENPQSNKKLLPLLSHIENLSLVLIENKKLTPTEIGHLQKVLPALKIEEFKLDPVVFKFLEAIAPTNQKNLLPLWQKYRSSEEPEIILTMLARQIRLLLLVKSQAATGPEDFLRLSPWQKSRLSSQSQHFTLTSLLELHHQLLNLDYQNKTGTSLLSLPDSLELLLLRL
ncbi:MAG: hypothetical protein UY21_C0016G0011 [Microgenomates group bacterium GW2011_GWA1_48_10]|uniref:DNA-directed DNA polymerase n=1 Tax=Candidatus Gottesmanbacteria bacterium RIFCSPHIGHO2_01_FULL_47_48 TaxID=1798381 RepID=A0A1F5ZZY5_9BACT|nr:MAG: hypothetical protein UY21_C0016G0011 [Microgenomates group bacterium GW2011_GWA1_48_10]OGG17722.1 MAG: hypothetical protein A2721_00575 [Candidatus Gottesmanbacteria bacterium RIFCSPHIGHO2_01_FULL_47_48]